ncbi:MAG: SAM-dependent methyltransferase [Kiritimatiellae bacterium]|nr:SAM-dependent methyltransferase [Kiritimatiellia bacterium]
MAIKEESLPGAAFLAFPGQAHYLGAELAERFGIETPAPPETPAPFVPNRAQWLGDLLYLPDFAGETYPYWAKTTLPHPFLMRFGSIGEAAKGLMAKARNWTPYCFTVFRRTELVQEKLPFLHFKPRAFPYEIPHTPMGFYTLLDGNALLASAETGNCAPGGAVTFIEDHTNPPSRAYLKLQEALTWTRHFFGVELPHAGQRCFDAGACPGGWSWVLRGLGADVFAVDRSELAPGLMHDKHVTFQRHDAFTLRPEETGPFDWVVSDVICYPERLLPWIEGWIASGLVRNMVCTIKLQGGVDWGLIDRFAALPDSRVIHLNYNKHELTFLHAAAKR